MAALTTLIQNIGANATQYNQVFNQVENRLYQFMQLNQQLNAQLNQTTINVDQRVMGGGGGSFGRVALQIYAVRTAIRGIEDVIGGVIGAVESLAGAFYAVGAAAVKLGMDYEVTAIRFEVMARDAERGKKLFQEIQQVALATPFQTVGLSKAGEMLLGMGVDVENIIPSLWRLGAVAGGDEERLRRLSLAFGQVTAAGHFRGEELRQFSEIGIGVKDFAVTMGISVGRFRQMMKEGAIGADVVGETFNRLTEGIGRFASMNERSMNTVKGQWSNLVESLQIIGARMSVALFGKFDVAGKIGNVADWISSQTDRVFSIVGRSLTALYPVVSALFDFMKAGWNAVTNELSRYLGSLDLSPAGLENIKKGTTEALEAFINFSAMAIEVLVNIGKAILDWVVRPLTVATKAALEFYNSLPDVGGAAKSALDKAASLTNLPGMPASLQTIGVAARGIGGILPSKAGGAPEAQQVMEQMDKLVETMQNAAGAVPASVARMAQEMKDRMKGVILDAKVNLNVAKISPERINIKAEITPSKEVEEYAKSLQKHLEDAISPLSKFLHGERMAGEALKFDLISMNQLRESRAARFEDLEKGVSKRSVLEEHLPKAMLRGSAEAEDVINKSNLPQTKNTLEEILQVMTAAREDDREKVQRIRDINAAMDELAKRGFLKKGV